MIALYVRVSSDKQAKEGDSIPAQVEALQAYAKAHQMPVYDVYIDDGISGTKYDRDELQRLLEDVKAHRIDLILVTKADRLHRSLRNFLNFQDVLDKNGCDWRAISEPSYDTTTPQGRMIINLMMNLAQFEAEQTGQRIRQVQKYKTQKREVISGAVTPGYKIENKHLVIDAEKAEAVRLVFRTFNETGSYFSAIRAGYGYDMPITQAGIKKMLTREIYVGRRHGMDDFAPALIDRDLFESVQRQISTHGKQRTEKVNLFSGLLICGDCGCKLSVQQRKNRSAVYRCPCHYNRPVKTCVNTRSIAENVLEKMLVDMLPRLIVESVKEGNETTPNYDKQREAIKRKIDRLKELYINDLLTLDEYKTDKEKLINELNAIPTTRRTETALKQLEGLDIIEIYSSFTQAEKRQFWHTVVKSITFNHERHFSFVFW